MARRTTSNKVIENRRVMILEMIMADPTKRWSYNTIAEEARKLPWFKEHMPKYSYQTAYLDYLAIKEETKENREKLAETILVRQLDETEEQIGQILLDIESLGSLEDFMPEARDINDIAQFAKTKNTLLNSLERLMSRQASLVPIEVPKQVNVEQSFTIDHYLQARKDYMKLEEPKKQLYDGNVEEGDYDEIDD